MRRLVYVAFGATLAVLVYRKAEKVAEGFTPLGIAGTLSDSLSVLGMGVHDFASEVKLAMTERESELRLALGLEPAPLQVSGRALPAGAGAADGLPALRPGLATD